MSSFALHRTVPRRVAGNCSFYRDLFALIGTIQERDDLCTGAAIGGAERGSGRAVGHAVLHCPCHSASAEGISRHIGKAVDRAGSRTQRTVQERHTLTTGAGILFFSYFHVYKEFIRSVIASHSLIFLQFLGLAFCTV